MRNDEYENFLARYTSSIFQYFESYHGTEFELVQDDIGLVSDECKSSFIPCELFPGSYTFEDLFEVLLRNSQLGFDEFNNPIDFEFDDFIMKKELVVKSGIIFIRFDEK